VLDGTDRSDRKYALLRALVQVDQYNLDSLLSNRADDRICGICLTQTVDPGCSTQRKSSCDSVVQPS
jgi:hypothetical protein